MCVARAASSPLCVGFAVVAEDRRCSPAAEPGLLPAGASPVAEHGLSDAWASVVLGPRLCRARAH